MGDSPKAPEKAELAAIILAAGASARMAGTDKLFAAVGGRPVLAYSLEAFQRSRAIASIVLVASSRNIAQAERLVQEGGFSKVAAVCPGGPRRQDSVRAGLQALAGPSGKPPCRYVAVHDGARPFITPALIQEGLEMARRHGAALPVLPVPDSVKEVSAEGLVLRTLDRSRLRLAQTPQVFAFTLLERAHREVTADVTDDAAMLELLGLPVATFPGSPRNIKITTPEDLELVRAFAAMPEARTA